MTQAARRARPGGIALSDDHADLKDSVRAVTARRVSAADLRAAIDAPVGEQTLPAVWADLVGQGLLGLHLPEQVGGAGAGLLEQAIVLEELGSALVPGPYLPTVLASAVLSAAGHRRHLAALASGEKIAALGLAPLTGHADGAGLRVSGSTGPVIGLGQADLLVAPVAGDETMRWVVLEVADHAVVTLPSHDVTRAMGTATFDGASVAADDILAIDDDLARGVVATLVAAEAVGIADWAVDTAADYALVREQFGRPIGQFQGVKHRAARMVCVLEEGRAAVWDAARALDDLLAGDSGRTAERDEALLTAAVAGAAAVDAGLSATKDCIQILGGIGFTWEHLAGFYFRRAHSLRSVLGPSAQWYAQVGSRTLAGARRNLTLDLPEGADAIRAEIRTELAEATGLEGSARTSFLAERGYTTPHLPKPWGKGADAVTQLVIAEELRAADLVPHDMVIGNWVVPTVVANGTQAQIDLLVPDSLAGRIRWCQLFSEPGAGSDLAALATRATKVDGGWSISGQKIWTSMAREADYAILLARTDPTVAKHKGISYFLLKMSTPGIDVRPLRELTGEALFNEVFLDDVFIPDDMLVGEPGDGWKLARTTLANERVSMGRGHNIGAGERHILDLAARHLAAGTLDVEMQARLGRLMAGSQIAAVMGLRTTMRSLAGQQPGAESSVGKLLGVERAQQIWETAMEWEGPETLTHDPHDRGSAWLFLSSRALTIAGGSTEVQLNIIGERILGLPRDPEPGR